MVDNEMAYLDVERSLNEVGRVDLVQRQLASAVTGLSAPSDLDRLGLANGVLRA